MIPPYLGDGGSFRAHLYVIFLVLILSRFRRHSAQSVEIFELENPIVRAAIGALRLLWWLVCDGGKGKGSRLS